jgi:hypothetical protein
VSGDIRAGAEEAPVTPAQETARQRREKVAFNVVRGLGLFISLLIALICIWKLVNAPADNLSDGARVILGGFLGGALSSVLEIIRTARAKRPARAIFAYVLNMIAAPFIGAVVAGLAVLFGFVTNAGKIELPGVTIKAVKESGYAGLGASIGFYAQTLIASVVPTFFKLKRD